MRLRRAKLQLAYVGSDALSDGVLKREGCKGEGHLRYLGEWGILGSIEES